MSRWKKFASKLDPTNLGYVKMVQNKGLLGAAGHYTGVKTIQGQRRKDEDKAFERQLRVEDRKVGQSKLAQDIANQQAENTMLSTAVSTPNSPPKSSKTGVIAAISGAVVLVVVGIIFFVLRKKNK